MMNAYLPWSLPTTLTSVDVVAAADADENRQNVSVDVALNLNEPNGFDGRRDDGIPLLIL